MKNEVFHRAKAFFRRKKERRIKSEEISRFGLVKRKISRDEWARLKKSIFSRNSIFNLKNGVISPKFLQNNKLGTIHELST